VAPLFANAGPGYWAVADEPIVLSLHAQDMVGERDIDPQWIEHVLQNPVFEEPDPRHPGAVRAYAPIAAIAGRQRGVGCHENDNG
jgi:hypothetical protein